MPIDSGKYEQWQVLTYPGPYDETWFKLESELHERWLASQPLVVELQPYTWPTKTRRVIKDGDISLSQGEQWAWSLWLEASTVRPMAMGDDPVTAAVALGASTPAPTECLDTDRGCSNPQTETHSDEKSPDAVVADLEHTFMCVMPVLPTEGNDDPADDDYAVHVANYISLEDYGQELAFLPDLTELSVTELDYIAPNVKDSSFVGDQQRRLDDVLKKHEAIMVLSGNTLPPAAYGVVCDIDVQGHATIATSKANSAEALTEALRLRTANDWPHHILQQSMGNGQEIRLCIDYKMVSAVTAIMVYAMPLVDELLAELEIYLWFCSLDTASGLWAIVMTMRARMTSAFVCALGHFEWLRKPLGLKNAPMIY
ncbi:hypothetical protein PHMEG_0006084 [Phytophthora megakarya]|uniref:Reverse transcriptase n=1 Tax=Phytophthora megakarya TaxID=4795 RepID=A0A225WQ12_9STRA|nr:hypothetical protein PHMEG_0006084 [Phytophthora megakarya]